MRLSPLILLPHSAFILVILFSIINPAPCLSQYYPTNNWKTKSPEKAGMQKSLVDSAVALALASENTIDRDLRAANFKAYTREPYYTILGPMKVRGGPAGVIIKNGYIVAQWGDANRVDMTFSVTKGYLSMVAGLAVDKGLIKNVNDLASKYVLDGTFEGAHNGKVTWKHLLEQTSDWSGCHFGTCDWADNPPKEGSVEDWKNRPLNEPGTQFEDNDTRVNILSCALLQVFHKPLPEILKANIMDPIGASTTWQWHGYDSAYVNIDGKMMQTVSGGGHFGGGIFINTMDQARFGLLVARNGKWNNKQLISSTWIHEASQPSTAQPGYGYLWWTNAKNRFPGAPSEVFTAIGFGGNYIVIDQAHDLVIVTRWMDYDKIDDFVSLIMQSLE